MESKVMVTEDTTEQVLWMADCYSLAKRFPNPHTWLALLEPVDTVDFVKFNPFHYWLWMEIWKAAQLQDAEFDLNSNPDSDLDRELEVAARAKSAKPAVLKAGSRPKLAAQQSLRTRQ
jgi:hypothetical protein